MVILDSFVQSPPVITISVRMEQPVDKLKHLMNVTVFLVTLVNFVPKPVILVVAHLAKMAQPALTKVQLSLPVCVLGNLLVQPVQSLQLILETVQTIHVSFKEHASKLFKDIVADVQLEELVKIVK